MVAKEAEVKGEEEMVKGEAVKEVVGKEGVVKEGVKEVVGKEVVRAQRLMLMGLVTQ